MKKNLPLSRVYSLLEPGPVVLVTTAQKGLANIITLSWHTMIDFEPPLIGCVMSERNHSFAALKATKQCVLNIPTVEIAKQVVGCGNTSGRKVNKFERFALTPMPAAMVDAPLGSGWLIDRIGRDFTVLTFGPQGTLPAGTTLLSIEGEELLGQRYDAKPGTTYLIRPDRYVAARWRRFDPSAIAAALDRALGKETAC